MTPSLTPAVAYIYYSNTEYNSAVFLDNNVYIRKNPSTDLVNDVFSTAGDILITGSVVYQGDSIYAQSQGFTGGYPAPAYGTSTRTLEITDTAGNTIYDFTGDYTTYSNINTTFTIVGGRNYYVKGRTNFTYPAAATLAIQNVAAMNIGGSGLKYYIEGYLSDAVEGDIIIQAGQLNANLYSQPDCGASELFLSNFLSDVTLNKGTFGFFNADSGQPYNVGLDYFNFPFFITLNINGTNQTFSNGGQFITGNTTVTVIMTTDCGQVYVQQ
jgi:hypothetical protein